MKKKKIKFPKIDLKELDRQIRLNKKLRRQFLDWYAKQVKEGKA